MANYEKKYISRLIKCLENVIIGIGDNELNYQDGIEKLINIFMSIRKNNSAVFFIGNGGSAAIASHMTADFMKNGGIITRSLYDSSIISCLSNDFGYEEVFAQQLKKNALAGDTLVAISSSGSSINILRAIEVAQSCGVKVISLTGFSPENEVRKKSEISVWVPCDKYGIVESIHTIVLQEIVDLIMERDSFYETSDIS